MKWYQVALPTRPRARLQIKWIILWSLNLWRLKIMLQWVQHEHNKDRTCVYQTSNSKGMRYILPLGASHGGSFGVLHTMMNMIHQDWFENCWDIFSMCTEWTPGPIQYMRYEKCCARSRYQGQGQIITSHRICVITCPCPWHLLLVRHSPYNPWASYEICKIADCACAGNTGNVLPDTAG